MIEWFANVNVHKEIFTVFKIGGGYYTWYQLADNTGVEVQVAVASLIKKFNQPFELWASEFKYYPEKNLIDRNIGKICDPLAWDNGRLYIRHTET